MYLDVRYQFYRSESLPQNYIGYISSINTFSFIMCQPVEILLHKNGQNVFYQLQEIQGDITDVLCLVNLVIKINELNIYPFVCVFEEVFVF